MGRGSPFQAAMGAKGAPVSVLPPLLPLMQKRFPGLIGPNAK